MKINRGWFAILLLALTSQVSAQNANGGLPPGYWPVEQSRPIIERTGTIRLAPDLSDLSAGEKAAVAKLLEAGEIFQSLFEEQLHPQAAAAYAALQALDRRLGSPEATRNLLTLYRINLGPIAATLDNKRERFLPVDPGDPGRNVYPRGIEKAEVEAWLAAHPEDAEAILGIRTVVRRTEAENLRRDLGRLAAYPALDTLHPGLKQMLERRLAAPDAKALYAVPYSVAYADAIMRAYALINEAADAVAKDDEEFARYLRNRSRDLISDDYESGDAAWITGRFKNLNAHIGAYETYDDELFGTKTFFCFSIMRLRRDETTALRAAMRGLQALEDSLPYAAHKTVRSDIPIGLYDVIADFGQARGGNTASIEPNEAYLARRYGRIILLRANIIRNPAFADNYRPAWQAAVAPQHRADYTPRGRLNQIIWHEVGHYLGVDATKDGRTLDFALQENSSTLEEMKADLVSMYVAEALQRQGYHSAEELRGVYGAGTFRTMNDLKPRRDQTYETMQLMQFNYFLENGLIAFDAASRTISVDYGRFHEVVAALLAKILDLQYQGDKAATDRFIDRYTTWRDDLHGVLGQKMLDAERYRFWRFEYGALEK